jgi:serine/threonine protein kinase
MTPERWQEIEEVLQAALDRSPEERALFIDEVCAGDDALKGEATSLISAYDEAGDFIEQPAIAEHARVLVGDVIDNNIGRAIGPYRIIELLGAGGMGEVYLAQDSRLDRLVALKILPPYFASDEERLRRFQREARAASALNHPNILTIHEVGEREGVYFIATEFIDGQTVSELLTNDELSLQEVLDIAEQVGSALSAAHTAGIVHRDIKPENVMRRSDGLVKILDFGIAKLLEPQPLYAGDTQQSVRTQTEAGLVMGTVSYMSPEQARGLAVDERTDIWSLGVVLYEMLARRLPFIGATRMDTMVAILEREATSLNEVAQSHCVALPLLQPIVDKSLRKEKKDRYQTANAMLADLNRVRQQLNASPFPHMIAAGLHDGDSPARHYFWPLVAVAMLVVAVAGTVLHRRANSLISTTETRTSSPPASATKLYAQMSEAEQLSFIDQQEQRISTMMGDRPVKLNDEAVRVIKLYVDRYAARGGASSPLGGETMNVVCARARPYVPLIAREFAARKVPVIIGIYLPVIESAYRDCYENSFGAKGLFQFMPQTAQHYGVAHEDMCKVEKMTPAAAHYIADRMAELGEDSESMTLVLLSYNRGAEQVRSMLRQVRDTDDYERNFWTLFAHRDRFDETFRKENAAYIPSFFAAAIIGENPNTFELQTPALSTLTSSGQGAVTR